MPRIAAYAVGFLLVSACFVTAQVKIVLPKREYKTEEQIQARLENRGSHPITICVQFGQSWPKGTDLGFVPTPFVREQNRNGKWYVLLDGPDVGSIVQAVELEAGKSMDFPFRLNARGPTRLRLDYWPGSKDVDCTARRHGAKRMRSATFIIE